MATSTDTQVRAQLERSLQAFTHGEIDFQALLAALDGVFRSYAPARRMALELVDQQQPTGALQRGFFRVLKERIEQDLRSGVTQPLPERERPPAGLTVPLQDRFVARRRVSAPPPRAHATAALEPAADLTRPLPLQAGPEPAGASAPTAAAAAGTEATPTLERAAARAKAGTAAPAKTAPAAALEPAAAASTPAAARAEPPPPPTAAAAPDPAGANAEAEAITASPHARTSAASTDPEAAAASATAAAAASRKPRGGTTLPPSHERPREHPFVTERRPPARPKPQPLAWIGGVIVLGLLFALVMLGPLNGTLPKLVAWWHRIVPATTAQENVTPAPPAAASAPAAAAPAPESSSAATPATAEPPPQPATATTERAAATADTTETTASAEAPASSAALPAGGDAEAAPSVPPASAPETGATEAATTTPPETRATGAPPATLPETTASEAPTTTPPERLAPEANAGATPRLPSTVDVPARASATPAPVAQAAPAAAPGEFDFAARAYSVRENGGMVALKIMRRGGSTGAVSVSWSTNSDSASAGSDYADLGGEEDFADGETQRIIYVPIANDAIPEGKESFTVRIAEPTGGATVGAAATATVTIVDDDP